MTINQKRTPPKVTQHISNIEVATKYGHKSHLVADTWISSPQTGQWRTTTKRHHTNTLLTDTRKPGQLLEGQNNGIAVLG